MIMDHKQMEAKLGKKVELGGRSLSEVLTAEEYALISFWSYMDNRAADLKAKRIKEPEQHRDLTEAAIDKRMQEEGQRILDAFNGDAQRALSSLG